MDLINLLKKQWDRAFAIALTVVGATMLISGWVGASGTPYLAQQAPYIVSGGLGGIFCLAIGATLWISADLRDEWRKLDRIEEALGRGVLRYASTEPAPDEPTHAEPPVGASTRTVPAMHSKGRHNGTPLASAGVSRERG